MNPTRWYEAPEVAEIADRLIPLYHPHLIEWDAQIRYVFRSRAQTTGGKTVWGKAHLLTAMTAYLAQPGPERDPDLFVLEIAADVWGTLTPAQHEALVDHELAHMAITVDEQGYIHKELRPHDIEEFDAIAARHGAWKPDLVRFANALSAGPEQSAQSDALLYPVNGEVAKALAEVRKGSQEAVADFLRRARGR